MENKDKKSARGGSRIGAGRKPLAEAEKLAYKSIGLFPHEWERLTELGSALRLSGPQAAAEILRRALQRR